MCITEGPVHIAKTKIGGFFVDVSGVKYQITFYAADITATENHKTRNTFILAVYNPGNDASKIIPLNGTKLVEKGDFFDDLESKCGDFDPWELESKGLDYLEEELIEVKMEKVGSYQFVVAPNKEWFKTHKINGFPLNEHSMKSINVHSIDYSFLLASFDEPEGQSKLEPFIYLSPVYKNNKIFFPTVHGHPAEDNSKVAFENKEKFDHHLYASVILSELETNQNVATHSNKKQKTQKSLIAEWIEPSKKSVEFLNDWFKTITEDYKGNPMKIISLENITILNYEIIGSHLNRNFCSSRKPDFKFDEYDSPWNFEFVHDLVVDVKN
jgi:hypothetical protein